ncbi:cilia- and flagella-associated protein 77 isoform X2 [Brienomyrus brachyistius]|uniref:cilia- and flagella-associated protein 77 isoform X2 n=1 Tax=Brienomyrus brachyistius TaxID=42636 RepID=UPI0020B33521|nr:cilia- and flagella-associated protein 77 isoform X2 [Brienomyrus brachyistius]
MRTISTSFDSICGVTSTKWSNNLDFVRIILPALGKTTSKGLSLPGPDFVYGSMPVTHDGGVAEAISHWHLPSPPSTVCRRRVEKDFVALNREGVKSGLVTAKEHHQYRATHDIRLAPSKGGSRMSAPSRLPLDMTFGVATRPSTPISELLGHRYAQIWLEDQQAKDRNLLERRKKRQLGHIPETCTTLLRKCQPLEEPAALWKLPRFQKVGPALDTFRDPGARKKAFHAHFSDSAARRGLLGQGTYNVN